MTADYLVAADGGQSFVRKSLGLKLEGQAFNGKFVIVTIALNSPFPTERRAWFDCACSPGSTMLMHKQPENIWRIDYQIADDADLDAAIQEVNVRPVVQRHLAFIGEAHLLRTYLWSSAYRAGTMTLANYVHGRVIFAGHAAHAMPIFGVRGLNSGLDDADNLIWKLALVVQGAAPEKLLDSYSTERIAAYHVNATNAGKSTEFMAPGSRGFALMREAALSLSLSLSLSQPQPQPQSHKSITSLLNPRQTSAVAYDVQPGLGDAFADGLQRGQVPLDVPVVWADGKVGHLLDEVQSCFTLLVLGDGMMAKTELSSLDVVRFSGPASTQPALSKAWGWNRAYLLRPDSHIAVIYRFVSVDTARTAIKTIVNGR